jgi:hypothetical protein
MIPSVRTFTPAIACDRQPDEIGHRAATRQHAASGRGGIAPWPSANLRPAAPEREACRQQEAGSS